LAKRLINVAAKIKNPRKEVEGRDLHPVLAVLTTGDEMNEENIGRNIVVKDGHQQARLGLRIMEQRSYNLHLLHRSRDTTGEKELTPTKKS